MLEKGERKPSSQLARKLMREYEVSPTVLPVSDVPMNASPDDLVHELASLAYPGFAHLRRGTKKLNPATFLLKALASRNLEARVVEGLPWLVFRYPDMDFDWLVPQARLKNLQNRLGFCGLGEPSEPKPSSRETGAGACREQTGERGFVLPGTQRTGAPVAWVPSFRRSTTMESPERSAPDSLRYVS